MKTINLLKKLIDLYYYLIGFAFIGAIFIPLIRILDINYNINFSGKEINLATLGIVKFTIVWSFLLLLFLSYFKAVACIRNSLKDLSNNLYFVNNVITSFKKAGFYLLACGAIELISKPLLSYVLNYKLKLSIDFSIALFIIIGLFFLFLSEVFLHGKKIEKENDLTI